MAFEFDPKKSEANKKKHGIDFIEAQVLWEQVTMEIPVVTADEPRWLVIGKIAKAFWTAVITYRGEDTVRIISVRRARKEERKLYDERKTEKDQSR